MKIGFTGLPDLNVIEKYKNKDAEFIDIDMPIEGVNVSIANHYVPQVYCATLRTILANALSLKDIDLFIFDVGEGKCDGMRFISHLIKKLTGKPVIETRNTVELRRGTKISDSKLPLFDKMNLIVDNALFYDLPEDLDLSPMEDPPAGFWGVPPNNFDILKLFPDGTRIFGWTRCLEDGSPADLKLEMEILKDKPMIFFAQQFCQKNSLAKYLAEETGGLYIEVDMFVGNLAKTKIEAYLHLWKR